MDDTFFAVGSHYRSLAGQRALCHGALSGMPFTTIAIFLSQRSYLLYIAFPQKVTNEFACANYKNVKFLEAAY